MKLLMLNQMWKKLERIYRQQHLVSIENCMKVLVRAKKMYESRNIIVKLIRMILRKESLKN